MGRPGPTIRSFASALACAALVAIAVAGGCYRPSIGPHLKCSAVGDRCPDGYTCNTNVTPALCVAAGKDAGAGAGGHGSGGSGGAAGRDGGMDSPPDSPPDVPCNQPVEGCTRQGTGLCDPVCQIGCGGCHQKCSVNVNGKLTCNLPVQGATPDAGQTCTRDLPPKDAAAQQDNCAAGQICLEYGQSCGFRCHKFCRTAADCPNSACSRDAGGGYSVCDVPYNPTCDPVPGATNNGCPNQDQNCYLTADLQHTLCDCENPRTDGLSGKSGDSCRESRDCLAGFVCANPTGGDTRTCLQLCRLSPDAGAQAGEYTCGGKVCTILQTGSTSPYGFCD
jgi:hypothetical protein